MALGNLTKLALRLGDVAAADEYANQCLALERATGNTRGILLSLECVGQVRLAQGDLPAARIALEESLALSRSVGDVLGEATALHHLGLVADAAGDQPEALRLLVAALARWHRVGDPEELAVCLDGLAGHLAGPGHSWPPACCPPWTRYVSGTGLPLPPTSPSGEPRH